MISNFQNDAVPGSAQADIGLLRARVSMNIGKALLQGAEQDQFRGLVESFAGTLYFQVDRDSASLRESLHKPAEGRVHTSVIEKRWVEQVRYGASFRNGVIQKRETVLNKRVAWQLGLKHRNGHFHCRQLLPHGIVKLAGKLPPFFILHGQ